MSEIEKSAEAYINAVREDVRTGDRRDSRGTPIEDLNEDEERAIRDFMQALTDNGQMNGFHHTLTIGPAARKAVLVFFAFAPLLREEGGPEVVYLSPSGETESRARNDIFSMRIMDPTTCETWDSATLLAQHGKLRDFRIIGDLDGREALGNTVEIEKGIVAARQADASLLLHREGDNAIVNPSKLGQAGCFSVLLVLIAVGLGLFTVL